MVTRVLILLLALATPGFAAEVAGVKIDDRTRVGESDLSLRGAGVRKRAFFQVYAIGLYVVDRKGDPLSQPGPKRVQIHMLRNVGADTFVDALVEGVKANHTEAEAKAFEPRLNQLSATIAQLKEARKGMTFSLDWNGKATQLLVDGKASGGPIEGEDFYRALLKIWLGEKPVQEDLKRSLLGA